MSTDKQISFYNSLLNQIAAFPAEFSADHLAIAREAFPARTVADASDAIARAKRTVERLKATTSSVKVPAAVEVADGHYALLTDGVVKFYSVTNVTEGKWAGFTFVNAQASDEYHKVGRESSARILAEIASDPQAAMKLYGHSLGKCGHCNRTLTDEASRAAGIGPICARKLGW